jgi:hypothetical protein
MGMRKRKRESKEEKGAKIKEGLIEEVRLKRGRIQKKKRG